MDDLIVVDCQNDFISGTLACEGGAAAAEYLADFINAHPVRALFTADWHSPANRSFRENGGVWPVHCVAGTRGAALADVFSEKIRNESNRPSGRNTFRKGKDDLTEEYSAFGGTNDAGERLGDAASRHVYVGGIASEYCVRETVLSLLASERSVSVLVKGLAWVSEADHRRNLADLLERGVRLID